MGNILLPIEQNWVDLAAKKGAVSPEFWQNQDIYWNTHFTFLYSFLESKKETGINESDRIPLTLGLKKLSDYVSIQLDKDQLMVDPLAYHLTTHYTRNGVHSLFMLSDIEFDQGEPLPAHTVRRLLKILDDMKNFWSRLKEATKEK